MTALKILFICTSHDSLGDTLAKTGLWLEELAAPYYIFTSAGATVTLASPTGGLVPIDPKSESIMGATRNTKRFLKDPVAIDLLAHSSLLDEINEKDFDVAFVIGGHGALWDIAGNQQVKQLLQDFIDEDKIIAAISQGVSGLFALREENGFLLVKGKKVTGFSNSEEAAARLTETVPFLLESVLNSLGAVYSSGQDYTSYVVVDGNLITGQNAASAAGAAEKMLMMLQVKNYGAVTTRV